MLNNQVKREYVLKMGQAAKQILADFDAANSLITEWTKGDMSNALAAFEIDGEDVDTGDMANAINGLTALAAVVDTHYLNLLKVAR